MFYFSCEIKIININLMFTKGDFHLQVLEMKKVLDIADMYSCTCKS